MSKDEQLSASQQLLNVTVAGQRGNTWTVTQAVRVLPGETPGNFSFTYKVVDSKGNEAFMKASDLGMFSQEGMDFLSKLLRIGSAHQFEREVLDHCRGNNMDRVVTAVDYGDMETTFNGVRDRVFFIIFELAVGDLRRFVRANERQDIAWSLNVLRNLFVGINQLHSGGICHNDFKPANALVFDDVTHKVADLGQATSSHIRAPHTGICVGDFRYAAPEQMYEQDRTVDDLSDFDQKRAGDLYSLASMIHYLITKRMISPEIIQAPPEEHKPTFYYGGWQESFGSVLPYWRQQFDPLMRDMKVQANTLFAPFREAGTALAEMVLELGEPDPKFRGHPSNRRPGQDQFGLQRYITKLELLARRAAIRSSQS